MVNENPDEPNAVLTSPEVVGLDDEPNVKPTGFPRDPAPIVGLDKKPPNGPVEVAVDAPKGEAVLVEPNPLVADAPNEELPNAEVVDPPKKDLGSPNVLVNPKLGVAAVGSFFSFSDLSSVGLGGGGPNEKPVDLGASEAAGLANENPELDAKEKPDLVVETSSSLGVNPPVEGVVVDAVDVEDVPKPPKEAKDVGGAGIAAGGFGSGAGIVGFEFLLASNLACSADRCFLYCSNKVLRSKKASLSTADLAADKNDSFKPRKAK